MGALLTICVVKNDRSAGIAYVYLASVNDDVRLLWARHVWFGVLE